ncbi:hypothetical protein OG883_00325 [Streptomyces sp. NBC_01142]|uniref:hypothetical protein n=1 Tax=Streptomyces sp. NBC_01142 TaxID=2975865 RepID=UPI002252985C|nr:hypothetical protein [Streptomyces sp. NBC_01142]MCX4818377.1 hypothetical protein [Streptomyces sp. NBC_01142]
MNLNTRTRTRSRRGRSDAREAVRDERRAAIRVLLARADRGVLGPEETVKLRQLVEAEVADGDAFRRSAAGQQAAALRLTHRVAAAEQAIVEAEAERDQYAAEVESLRTGAGVRA